MDPLSSLSLAGTAVQFLQFVASLLRNTRKIHNSAAGLSSESELLEAVYGRLSHFSSELATEAAPERLVDGAGSEEARPRKSSNEASIVELAKICKCDCDVLLGILEKLRKKSSSAPKWWKSFQAALCEVTKADEVKEIKARIERNQTQMVFYLCLASR